MKTNRMQLMSEGDVSKSLFKLGIPMVVSMLVTALYNVVDTYFVSGLGTQQVAAVSVAFPISFIFSGIGLTFGVGAGSYISRLLGKQDMEKAHQVASTAMFSSVLTSIIAAGIIYAMLTPVLTFTWVPLKRLCPLRDCNLDFANCYFGNLYPIFRCRQDGYKNWNVIF